MVDRDAPWGAGTPSRAVIAATALRVVDADGLGELSIRKLAAEVGVHPTALYRRVANRDEILDMVANEVLAEIELEALTGAPCERLVVLAMEYRSALRRHPHATALLNSWTTAQQAIVAVSEAVFDALSEAGLHGQALLEAYNTYLGYVHGASVTEVLTRPTGLSPVSAQRHVSEATWTAHSRLAAVVAQFDNLISSMPEAELRTSIFRAGVETILAGFQARYGVPLALPVPDDNMHSARPQET